MFFKSLVAMEATISMEQITQELPMDLIPHKY